jgi:autotransporter passenger strand-loop-strand repeat protein
LFLKNKPEVRNSHGHEPNRQGRKFQYVGVRFDLVVNGGAMFVLSGGVADTTTVDAGGVYVLD